MTAVLRSPRTLISDSFWNSLRSLAIARLLIAAILVLVLPAYARRFEATLLQDNSLFLLAAGSYVLFAIGAWTVLEKYRHRFNSQLAVHLVADLIFLSVFVYAAGGPRSGFGLLMMAPVAGAAILVSLRWALFTAAVATVSLLGQAVWFGIKGDAEPNYFSAAVAGVVLFGIAIVLNQLAARAASEEARAKRRGVDLRNQLAVNQLVISELSDGVLVFTADAKVRSMNRAAQQMLGANLGAAQAAMVPSNSLALGGSTLSGFIPTGYVWNMIAEQLRAWQMSGSPAGYTVDVGLYGDPQSDATAVQQRVRLKFLSAQQARGQSIAGQTTSEVTDSVLVLEDLNRVEEQAQQLKLASMGRLSASIAHEIRNPLGAIRHANSLLAEGTSVAQSATAQRLSRIIEDNTVRINRIIEDVLAIARRDRAQGESIDLAGFLGEFLPELVTLTQCPGERIRVDMSSTQPLFFDPSHLRQVLINLLGNALRYCSPAAGSIVIVWRRSVDGRMELIVADDGPGLSSTVLPHLFEPFVTTESKGTGLGLYLARELCAANDAQLRYSPGILAHQQSAGHSDKVAAFVISVVVP
jgi:two-component system, NtrC family, sensor histidine kinase PilS